MRPRAPVALLALVAATGGAAQPAFPPREQEPRPGVVREREAAAGLAPSAQQGQAAQQTLDQIYQELTGTSPDAPASPAPLGPPLSREAGEENRLYRDLTGANPNPAR